jgi:ATP-dependent RNA helicase RhlB
MSPQSDIPSENQRADRPRFLTESLFEHFDLPEPLLKGLFEEGFVNCTPIQSQTLPVSLEGKDVAGQAQTGTGKTAAFLVTLFTRLMAAENTKPGMPMALIVAPTRELALQIYEEAQRIGKYLPFSMAQIVGGVDYVKQADLLKEGVDIVICTPGRVIDYFKQKIFKTDNIRIVVIDEADRLLDLGFAKDMRYILKNLPSYEKRQSMLFSATLSYRVMELTYEYMNLPEFIAVTPEDLAVEGIDQELYHVGKDEKLSLLLGLLTREDWNRMLIFVNTKIGVEWLAQKLKGNGWPARAITGDMPQRKRFRLMDDYKDGKIKILVATDVASRGIHVEDITHVVNYDLPQDPENYVHRIGRTARAGKSGRALSLACETYVLHLQPMEDYLDFKIPVAWPKDDWFVADTAGPVAADRRRSRRKPSGPKTGGPRKGKPAGGRSRGPRTAGKPRTAAWPSRPEGYFPGTFFGFAPTAADAVEEDQEAVQPASEEETTPATEAAADAPKPRKRSRRRKPRKRKKRAAPPREGAAAAADPAAPSEVKAPPPADDTASD